MTDTSANKVILVLGAGFSAPGSMPLQASLMRDVVSRHSKSVYDAVRDTYRTLFDHADADDMADVPLEDVFTMLDRAIHNRETLPSLDHTAVRRSREELLTALALSFNRAAMDFSPEVYRPFFVRLLSDPGRCPTLITLNWDTIVEQMIATTAPGTGIDYGCDIQPLQLFDKAVSEGHPEVSVLKLHGSIDWLVCSICGQFWRDAGKESLPVAIPFQRPSPCCSGRLESTLITPTLLKDLGRVQTQQIWHRALLALREAERVVFLGYSLPLSDFEFRYLLLRTMIGRTGSIELRATLYPPDDACATPKQRWQRDEVQERFKAFFGGRDIAFAGIDIKDMLADPCQLWSW